MLITSKVKKVKLGVQILILIYGGFCLLLPLVYAAPPHWAPAYGYHKKKNKAHCHQRNRHAHKWSRGHGKKYCHKHSAYDGIHRHNRDRSITYIKSNDDFNSGDTEQSYDDYDRVNSNQEYVSYSNYDNEFERETVEWRQLGEESKYISHGRCKHSKVNRVMGTLVGGLIGSRIGKGDGRKAATIVGALLGYHVGKKADNKADAYCTSQALEYTSSNTKTYWTNADTGTHYTMYPTRTYREYNTYCRHYVTEENRHGNIRTIHRKACRQSSGAWRVID